jgi:hypothetical protein
MDAVDLAAALLQPAADHGNHHMAPQVKIHSATTLGVLTCRNSEISLKLNTGIKLKVQGKSSKEQKGDCYKKCFFEDL